MADRYFKNPGKHALGFALTGFLFSALFPALATAADVVDPSPMLDPTPMAEQLGAVDGINFQFSGIGGSMSDNTIGLFMGSVATPMPFIPSMGIQFDGAAGTYAADIDGNDYTTAAGGLHIFWRDPQAGMIGAYGDWGFISPEHSGRVGMEMASYNGRWTFEGLAGVQFGQNVNTRFVDEIDINYYFTDDFRASIGQRLTSRGNVLNANMEWAASSPQWNGWSLTGEVEGGEDNYFGAWGGVRFVFGTGASEKTTLIERDRGSFVRNRLPRIISSVTQCGKLPNPKPANSWRSEMSTLCASEDELRDENARIEKLR